MKVLLFDDVESLGWLGDIVDVKVLRGTTYKKIKVVLSERP